MAKSLMEKQYEEAIDLLTQRGVDVSTIPASVANKKIVSLVFRGCLGQVQPSLDLGSIIRYLRRRNDQLALWAFEYYPEFIEIKRKQSVDLLYFKLPPQVGSPKQRPVSGLEALGFQVIDTVTGSNGREYTLFSDDCHVYCTCPAASFHHGECKHVRGWKGSNAGWRERIATRVVADQWSEYTSG